MRRDLSGIWDFTHTAAFKIILYVSLAVVVLAALDYLYQRWQHEENLKAQMIRPRRIFVIAATIYFYDHTQKVVDLHEDIRWTDAGKLSANGGDYIKSLPKYDKADAIYTKMLDDLKGFSDELNTINVKAGIQAGFKTQDFINKGNLVLWKKYCNSLRLRILTRVAKTPAFQSRPAAEINGILSNAAQYPVITDNADNIQVKVFDLNTRHQRQRIQERFGRLGWQCGWQSGDRSYEYQRRPQAEGYFRTRCQCQWYIQRTRSNAGCLFANYIGIWWNIGFIQSFYTEP